MDAPSPVVEIRWSRIAAVLLVALLLLEGMGQVAIYAWSGKRYQSLFPYVWSPYGLVRNNPRLTSPAFAINGNGFREMRDYTQRKPPRTLRVLMLGGSTLYAGLQAAVVNVIPDTVRVDSHSTMSQFLRDKMAADPELAGVDIEVINAAVNFNTIVEVSSAYLAEYAHWDPDFVIVAGSANNFSRAMPSGAMERRDYGILGAHNWRGEFDRLANGNNLLSSVDNTVRALSDHSAAAAIGVKLVSKVVDAAIARVGAVRDRVAPAGPPPPARALADWREFDEYIAEYLGYAAAMTAVAQHHGQQIAFFWEHLLAHVGDSKPLTPDEQKLFAANVSPRSKDDARYTYYAREKVDAFCAARGAVFLDPIERLKRHPGSVFIDYLHYTAEGNRFMSEFIYDEMREAFRQRAAELEAAPSSR